MPGLNTFPRGERLTRRRDFEAVYEHGRKRVGPAFVCYVARRQGQGRKIGFAVSRKIGGAVVRNRIKRYLREFYRTHRSRLQDDVHLVIVARPVSAELSYRECAEAMQQLLRESGAITNGAYLKGDGLSG